MKNKRFFVKPALGGIFSVLLLLAGCASLSPAPVRDGQSAAAAVSRDSYTVKSGDTLYSIAREQGMDHRELIALNGIQNPNQIPVGRVLKIKPKQTASSQVATISPITSDVVQSRPMGDEPRVEQQPMGRNSEVLKREPKAGKEPYSDQALALALNQDQPAEPIVPPAKTEVRPDTKTVEPAEPVLSGDDVPWIWPANGKIIGTFSEGGSKGVDISGRMGEPVIAAGDGKVVYSGTGLRGYGKLVIIKHNNTYLSAYAHNQNILVKEGQSVTRSQKIAEMGNTDADQVKLHFEVRRLGKPVDPLKYLPQR